MGIKRLIQNSSSDAKFLLDKDKALILIQKDNKELECLYIIDEPSLDLSKLSQFNSIVDIRYIGSKEILARIKELKLNWPPFSREVYVEGQTEAVFYSHSGKVRIEKRVDSYVKKKVLIIDDSKSIQKLLTKIINKSSKLEVIGVADRPSKAREFIEKERPDIITLDIHMPEMTGVDFLKSYLAAQKIATIMISSVSLNEGPLVMEALSNGALTYIQKPSLEDLDELTSTIISEIESIADHNFQEHSSGPIFKKCPEFTHYDGLIAIGSSTGGTQALQKIFTSLPDRIPPIIVTQHIPSVFSKALAERLNGLCQFTVKEAENGELLDVNTIYIAPGGKQFKVVKSDKRNKVVITDDEPVNRFRPSVDYLFDSVAKLKQKNTVGVILTGMGKDGAEGLLKMKNSGAITFAQDQSSSIVFGMPKMAIEIGAAQKIVHLSRMAEELVMEFNKFKKDPKKNSA